MGRLRDYFESNKGRLIHKWLHYFDIYEHHFNRYVGKDVNILEIGVSHGGSLQMWKNYFGNKATIYGLDVNPACKALEEDQINIIIGDQANQDFWKAVKPSLPVFDIIIDDGGHFMKQQKITFEEMFPDLSDNGVYLIEDLHTSYWSEYGGGYGNQENFIEYSKKLIDSLNAWYSRDPLLSVGSFTRSVWSMSYYDSVLVIEKRPKEDPKDKITGNRSW